jgi:hypothetical protein
MKRATPSDLAADLFGATPARRLTLMKAAWAVAVGADLARRSEVVALDGELLRVRVPDATWRRSLWRMRSDLLARLRQVAGSAAPHALGFAEGPVADSEARDAPPRSAVGTVVPLPPALAAAADKIPDPEARERFRQAAGRYLGRFATLRKTEP